MARTHKSVVNELMAANGFEQWHTGGGIVCWGREGLDGSHYLVTYFGGDTGSDLYGPVNVPSWGICRTEPEGFTAADSDYQDAHGAHTLREALVEVAKDIGERGQHLGG